MNFKLVSEMNEAFGNPKGDPTDIKWADIQRQCKNIGNEFAELMAALGAEPYCVERLQDAVDDLLFSDVPAPNLDAVRDGLCDIHVFAYGAHHKMGVDADRDMAEVVGAVMTRFVKTEFDLEATLKKHAARGITQVYTEGAFPKLILKSACDQPDAPKGKFLKSASYREPVFYDVNPPAPVQGTGLTGIFDPLPFSS